VLDGSGEVIRSNFHPEIAGWEMAGLEGGQLHGRGEGMGDGITDDSVKRSGGVQGGEFGGGDNLGHR